MQRSNEQRHADMPLNHRQSSRHSRAADGASFWAASEAAAAAETAAATDDADSGEDTDLQRALHASLAEQRQSPEQRPSILEQRQPLQQRTALSAPPEAAGAQTGGQAAGAGIHGFEDLLLRQLPAQTGSGPPPEVVSSILGCVPWTATNSQMSPRPCIALPHGHGRDTHELAFAPAVVRAVGGFGLAQSRCLDVCSGRFATAGRIHCCRLRLSI